MKHLYSTLLAFGFSATAIAQITITEADMPAADDTIRMSTATDANIDFITTGPNSTWDFSGLVYDQQTIDTFFSVDATEGAYVVFFDNQILWPEYKSNYGIRGTEFDLMGFLSLTSVFDFYQYDTVGYRKVGYGAMLNGLPTPVRYDSIENIYNFPMNYTDMDSSGFAFDLTVPTFGHYGGTGTRYTEVDGWGTLILPMGSFQTLRVKHEIQQTDTIYVDMVGFGFNIPRPTTYEYQWLSNDRKAPLMTITTSEFGGNETVTNIRYQDTIRTRVGINEWAAIEASLYPNPTSETLYVRAVEMQDLELVVRDAAGRVVEAEIRSTGPQSAAVNTSLLTPGVYLLWDAASNRLVGRFVKR